MYITVQQKYIQSSFAVVHTLLAVVLIVADGANVTALG